MNKSRKDNLSSRKKIFAWVVIGSLTLFALVGFSVYFALFGGNIRAEYAMASHLKEKYGENFTISDAEYINGGFAVDGLWKATAKSNSDTSIEFEINANKNLSLFDDQYMAVVWAREQSSILKDRIKRVFVGLPTPRTDLDLVLSGRLSFDATNQDSYNNVIDAAPDSILHKLSIDAQNTEVNSIENYNSKIISILEHYSNDGVQKLWLTYRIENKNGNSYSCENRLSNLSIDLQSFDINNCLKIIYN